jgi:hypothetical protein
MKHNKGPAYLAAVCGIQCNLSFIEVVSADRTTGNSDRHFTITFRVLREVLTI